MGQRFRARPSSRGWSGAGAGFAASGLLTGVDPARQLSVDPAGATTLRLVVADGNGGDHVDWAAPVLAC
ncbi:NPCBM/NEW2 domain-containing protein [Kitasatospora sp. NPDC101155]|uniref:NPCBM/NEW2 domain-containing protein n=1 Tax=Kitasatospora sp. NPDC101155 TaxID=3364097 RepID=UPI00381881E3